MTDFKRLPTVNGVAVALAVDQLPIQPSDATVWVDASQLAGFSDGNPVAAWPDLSGHANHLIQATGGAQPTYKAAIQNGRPVVRFDGGDRVVSAAFAGALTQPTTITLVSRMSDVSAYRAVFDGILVTNRHYLLNNLGGGGDWDITAGASLVGGTPDTNWHLFTLVYNTTASNLRVDGISVATGNVGSQTLTGLTIGGDYSGASFLGDVGELLVVNRLLGAAEQAALESYLARKWAISVAASAFPPSAFASYTKWGTD